MASPSVGNLMILGDEETGSNSETEKQLKEEFGQEKAKIILHFFEDDLHSINENGHVTREASSGQVQRLIIEYSEKRAISVRKLIDDLKEKMRTLSEQEIDIPSSKINNLAKEAFEDNKDVLILTDLATEKVKIIGSAQDQVNSAAHRVKLQCGLTALTGNRRHLVSDRSEKSHAQFSIDNSGYEPEHSTERDSSPYRPSSSNDFYFENMLNGGLVLKVYKASITRLKVDTIVNAANESMMHGGGVARVISEAAGYGLDSESNEHVQKYGPVRVSENIVTAAGRLPYKTVIHAVGPVWHDYSDKADCLKDLYRCVWNILLRCEEYMYKSVGMSAISAGIFAVPKQLCADMYVKAAVDFSKKIKIGEYAYPKELHIIDIDTSILHLVKASVEKWQKDPSSIGLEVTLGKYMKDNPYASGNRWHSDTGNSGRHYRGHRSRGHGRGQGSNSNGSYDNGDAASDDSMSAETYRIKCTLKKKKEENFAWGGVAKVYDFDGQITVKIFKGDIDKSRKMDAIVCGTNKSFQASGYLHEALKTAGGPSFEGNFNRMVDTNKYSAKSLDVFKCRGGDLKVNHVIYVLIERIVHVNEKEIQTYQEAIKNVLEKARDWNLEKLVIPMFGTGNIQKNKNKLMKCCVAVMNGIDTFLDDHGNKSRLTEIHLVNNSDLVCSLLEEVFDKGAGCRESGKGAGSHDDKNPYSGQDGDRTASSEREPRMGQGSSRKTFTADGCEETFDSYRDKGQTGLDKHPDFPESESSSGGRSFGNNSSRDYSGGQRKKQFKTGENISREKSPVLDDESANKKPLESTEQQVKGKGNLNIIVG